MLPLAEDERAVPDERRRVGPRSATLGDLILARGHAYPEGGDRVEVGSLVREGERDVAARHFDVVEERGLRCRELRGVVLLRIHAVPVLAPGHDVAGERVLASRSWVAKPLPSVLEVVRREGLTV